MIFMYNFFKQKIIIFLYGMIFCLGVFNYLLSYCNEDKKKAYFKNIWYIQIKSMSFK
jgi:hypothetical protein